DYAPKLELGRQQNAEACCRDVVLAEVVYVLYGVYKTPKPLIAKTLSQFISLENISMHETVSIYMMALDYYQCKNLDFVDCCLCSRKGMYEIKSFDKKLTKCLDDEAL
ncbi:MAG: hypothetical protein U9Q92_07445, partial [archaeon]|nr:hypothetical protein [archaeon]